MAEIQLLPREASSWKGETNYQCPSASVVDKYETNLFSHFSVPSTGVSYFLRHSLSFSSGKRNTLQEKLPLSGEATRNSSSTEDGSKKSSSRVHIFPKSIYHLSVILDF